MTGGAGPARLGIVGGFTPAATARFYKRVSGEFFARTGHAFPDIIIHSVPIPSYLEASLIRDNCGASEELEVRALLSESCELLARSGASFVVAPCNTIQPLLRTSAEEWGMDCVDIIESTCAELARHPQSRATLVATSRTVRSRRYVEYAASVGVQLSTPSVVDQAMVDSTILGLAAGTINERTAAGRLAAILDAGEHPHDAVVLGCTDLSGLAAQSFHARVVDSLSCLAEASCDQLLSIATGALTAPAGPG